MMGEGQTQLEGNQRVKVVVNIIILLQNSAHVEKFPKILTQ